MAIIIAYSLSDRTNAVQQQTHKGEGRFHLSLPILEVFQKSATRPRGRQPLDTWNEVRAIKHQPSPGDRPIASLIVPMEKYIRTHFRFLSELHNVLAMCWRCVGDPHQGTHHERVCTPPPCQAVGGGGGPAAGGELHDGAGPQSGFLFESPRKRGDYTFVKNLSNTDIQTGPWCWGNVRSRMTTTRRKSCSHSQLICRIRIRCQ